MVFLECDQKGEEREDGRRGVHKKKKGPNANTRWRDCPALHNKARDDTGKRTGCQAVRKVSPLESSFGEGH